MLRLSLTLALLVPAVAAHADDGLRCGQRLVSVGEREEAVLQKCGPPTTAHRRYAYWRIRFATLRAVIDTWTYDRGPNEFVRVLTFENGVLQTVDLGDYGR